MYLLSKWQKNRKVPDPKELPCSRAPIPNSSDGLLFLTKAKEVATAAEQCDSHSAVIYYYKFKIALMQADDEEGKRANPR